VRPVALPALQQFDDCKKLIAIAELFTIHGANLRKRPELFGASLRYRIIAGGLVRAEDYIQAMRLRTDLGAQPAGRPVDSRSADAATSEPAGKLEPVPPSTLFTRASSRRRSMSVAIPPCRSAAASTRVACHFRCKLSASCSTKRRSCAPAMPTKKATPWRDKRPAL